MTETVFNPLAKKGLDLVRDLDTLDDRYVNITGDTMTGDLNMLKNNIILQDSSDAYWEISVNTDGALVTTEYMPAATTGSPMGLTLLLTYP